MKRNLSNLVFILSLCVMLSGSAFAQEEEVVDPVRDKTITEIGTLVNAQKYQIALNKCNAAMQKYPNEAFLYYWRGSIYYAQNNKQQAIVDLNKSIELDAKNSKAYVLRGNSKADLEDKDGALADYNKAIELDPKDSSAYSMRACVKLELGDFDGANEDLDMSNKLMNSK